MMNALLSLTVMQHRTHQRLFMGVLRWMCGTLLLILQVWLLDSCASTRSREFTLQPEDDNTATSATVYVTGTKPIDSLSAQELSKIFINVWKVETNDFPREIRVFARVMDSTGNFITGMAEPYYAGEGDYRRLWSSLKEIFRTDTVTVDEFSIREFGDKDSLQYDIGLVLDHGGSMGGAITTLQEAAQLFVGLRYPDDRIAVLKFDSKIKLETPLTKDSAALARSLQKHGLKDFGLYTALYDAIKAGILELATTATATARQMHHSTHHSTHHSKHADSSTHAALHLTSATEEAIPKALVIFTDGEDNFSTCDDAELYALAKKHNVHLFPVGFGYVNDEVLSNLATFTGGHYYKVYSKRELAAVFQDIYKSLRNFYKITYKPTPREGLRDIEIALNDLVELGYGRNPKRRRGDGDSAFAVNDSLARLALATLNDNTLSNKNLTSIDTHQQNLNPNDANTNRTGIGGNTSSDKSDANLSGTNTRNNKNVGSRNKSSAGSGGTNTRNSGLHNNNDSNLNSNPPSTTDKTEKENKNSQYAPFGRGNSKNTSGNSKKNERGNSSNSGGNANDSTNSKNTSGNDGNGNTNANGNDGNGSKNDSSRNNSNSSGNANDSTNSKNASGNDEKNDGKNTSSDTNGSTNASGNDGNGSKNDSDRNSKNASGNNSNATGNSSGNGSNFGGDGSGKRTNRIAVRVPVDVPMFKPVDSLNTVFTKLILFDFRKAELRPEALPLLDELAATLVKFSRIKLEVCGHTDNVGTEEFNQVLSEMRAAAVVRALVERGVRAERLRWRGFGFSQPLVPNDTEEQRQQNRRTEFRIIAR